MGKYIAGTVLQWFIRCYCDQCTKHVNVCKSQALMVVLDFRFSYPGNVVALWVSQMEGFHYPKASKLYVNHKDTLTKT